MTFLNPAFLYGLLLAGLPILIHFLARRRRTVIPFSTLRFLKLLESRRIRKLRVQQWILLALRTLAVAFLALGFARPAVRGSLVGGAGGSRTAAVLILDRSMSTGATASDQSVFGTLQDLGRETLRTLDDADDVYLLHSDDPAALDAAPITPSDAIRRIALSTPGFAAADLPALRCCSPAAMPTRKSIFYRTCRQPIFRASAQIP